jgi:hypothetical protein
MPAARFFADLTEEGTPYSKLNRIVEGLFLGPSQCSPAEVSPALAPNAIPRSEQRQNNAGRDDSEGVDGQGEAPPPLVLDRRYS